jgi:hypothetical protein
MTMKDLILAAQAGGMDLTAELLSCGCIDLLIECFFAVKKAGAENCNGIVMWYAHKQHSASDGYAMLCYAMLCYAMLSREPGIDTLTDLKTSLLATTTYYSLSL